MRNRRGRWWRRSRLSGWFGVLVSKFAGFVLGGEMSGGIMSGFGADRGCL